MGFRKDLNSRVNKTRQCPLCGTYDRKLQRRSHCCLFQSCLLPDNFAGMRPSVFFTCCAGVLFFAGACLSAALAISVIRHPDLVAYGSKTTHPVVTLMVGALLACAVAWLGFARFTWKVQSTRFWILAVALPICVLVSSFSVLGSGHSPHRYSARVPVGATAEADAIKLCDPRPSGTRWLLG